MAQRPIYIPMKDGPILVKTKMVEFQWVPGMSATQKQKSVDSLHQAAMELDDISSVLEVSSKSRLSIGVELSAFNLKFQTLKQNRTFCVECAFQGSKVFEQGGPFKDMFFMSARDAKKDERLRNSGRLTGFQFYGVNWDIEPQTAFYDWLYISALKKKPEYVEELLNFSAFSDIEFNPERSINCQAYSVALYLSLYQRNLIKDGPLNQADFLELIKGKIISNAREDNGVQRDFLRD